MEKGMEHEGGCVCKQKLCRIEYVEIKKVGNKMSGAAARTGNLKIEKK